MEYFYLLFVIVWGILSVVLFFKVWGMCNDVEKIASFLLSNKCEEKRAILEANKHHSEKKEEVKIEIVDLNELNGIAIGDSVEWKKNGKKMRVVSIKSNGIYECELGSMVLKFNFEDIKK